MYQAHLRLKAVDSGLSTAQIREHAKDKNNIGQNTYCIVM